VFEAASRYPPYTCPHTSHPNMHMYMCEILYGLERKIAYEWEGNQMGGCRAPLVVAVCEGGVIELEVGVFRLWLLLGLFVAPTLPVTLHNV